MASSPRRIGRASLLALLTILLALTSTVYAGDAFRPGARGAGDRYWPGDGNGGYDVRHYALDLRYRPRSGRLAGTATITAVAKHDLSRFNLDLKGMKVDRVAVNGRTAGWRRADGELIVDPAGPGIERGKSFRVRVFYAGRPRTGQDGWGAFGPIHTHDGLLVVGQPHSAAYWYPVNNHPTDKARYTFRITAPKRLEVVANGVLAGTRQRGDLTTWTWVARDPMASYLSTLAIGRFEIEKYRRDGVRYWDAVDPRLLDPVAAPRSGEQFLVSGRAQSSYKRLSRVIDVPPEGATVSFRIAYEAEPGYDFVFVEARPQGTQAWTTLKDERGHTTRSTGVGCPGWLEEHPFLRHYQTRQGDGCKASGTTGAWHAATGSSGGYQRWQVDLGRYAGQQVEISIAYVSDFLVQLHGAFVDDIVVSTGEGSTSFEPDSDPMDGWTVPGPPKGSPGNENDWIVGTAADGPPPLGAVARKSLDRQAEVLRFLTRLAGPYPFRAAGGIVDHEDLNFALETQTRPVYSPLFFFDQLDGDLVVVHELAHQWYGNSLRVRRWNHIWLNEGFATYAEWLWLEREGVARAGETFRDIHGRIPATSSFWTVDMVDPGPDDLFHSAVYVRGAMVLHALRQRVGYDDFRRILRRWAQSRAGSTVTTSEFIALAERVSGKQLDRLFDRWLFTPSKPLLSTGRAAAPSAQRSALAEKLVRRWDRTPSPRH